MLNQQTIIGIAEYVPIAAKKSAAYWSFVLSCTMRRIKKPVSETAVGRSTNTKRCRKWSDANAVIIASAKAQAHGGTESSWVRTAPCPRPWMMLGAKYAG